MVRVEKLQKIYHAGKKHEVKAVRNVSLAIQRGEIYGLLGPNGAGKSTTMRMLATLLRPSGGQAFIAGIDLLRNPDAVRSKIGYVGQHGGSKLWASGMENLVFQGRIYGLSKSESEHRAGNLVQALDLHAVCDRQVKAYSGGQKRKVDLAIGMVHSPDLLFLDEPTTGLDPKSRAEFWGYVRTIRTNGTTILLSTHYLDEADALCDRVAIVDRGTIQTEGSPEQLKMQVGGDRITLQLQEEGNRGREQDCMDALRRADYVQRLQQDGQSVRLNVDSNEKILSEVIRLIDHYGLKILRFEHARPTLDDVFLQYTGRSMLAQ
ncbi:ATP-binding cassette domain-containing protein [Paenibacillus sp. J2TS4]|uniref:ATP-binding cassette domain-containing protein n=1 Tax=Paenibacillus sp. J2TS4 TaxID=2807194 RepID=UPI001B0E680C|nr:ATP-binding cassette domain-containing protein [Paenibacillus sp. J2TS4]GIP33573.1 daunorubicin resistance protein DrrA family ABC transporter ATP-binding protein [Paenibacillus sp. J2TS4]